METRSRKRKREKMSDGTSDAASTSQAPLSTATNACLRNPLVLSKVASHLPGSTLLKTRLLSPAVNAAFLPSLREKHKPILIKGQLRKDRSDPLTGGDVIVNEDLATLLDRRRHENKVAFTKFHLKLSALTSEYMDHSRTMRIFDMVGHSITSLELKGSGPSGTLDSHKMIPLVRTLVFEKTTRSLSHLILSLDYIGSYAHARDATATQEEISALLPNLKSLEVKCEIGIDERSNELDAPSALRKLLSDIIRAAHGLSAIAATDTSGYPEEHGCNIQLLTALQESASVRLHLISRLTILEVRRAQLLFLTQLARLGGSSRLAPKSITTSLKYRSLFSTEWEEAANLLYNFLVTQKSTLLQLKLTLSCGSTFYDQGTAKIHLPPMGRLQTFSLIPLEKQQHELGLQFQSGNMASNYPNLIKFECMREVGHSGGMVDHFRYPAVLRHPNITALKLQSDITTRPALESLGRLYPSVRHLQLRLVYRTYGGHALWKYSAIWSAWPQLETLDLELETTYPDDILNWDEFITGVPGDQLQSIERSLKLVALTPSSSQLGALSQLQQKYKTRPGLPDLRLLRSCSIKMFANDFGQWGRVTDIGGCLGFALVAPSLQQLVIRATSRGTMKCRPPSAYVGNELSPECHAMVRSALGPYAAIEME